MKVRNKPYIHYSDAVLFDGRDTDGIHDLLEGSENFVVSAVDGIWIIKIREKDGSEHILKPGCWLIRSADKRVYVMDQKTFDKNFEPVEDE